MPILFTLLTLLMIVSAGALVLVILVQRPQGGGLAQAFGGAGGGGTDTAFGGRTGDALTVATWVAAGFFVLVAILINVTRLGPAPATPTPGVSGEQAPADGSGSAPGAPGTPGAMPMPAPGSPNAPRPGPGTGTAPGVKITPTAPPTGPVPGAAPGTTPSTPPVAPAPAPEAAPAAPPTAPPAPAEAPSGAPSASPAARGAARVRARAGFGAAAGGEDGARCSVEIRSVNNRFFKASLRLPESLTSLEGEIESQVSRRLQRGSVSVAVRFIDTSSRAAGRLNLEVLRAYLAQFEGLAPGAAPPSPASLLALPGVVIDDAAERLSERARPIVTRLIDQACDRVLEMRSREGESLRRTLEQLGGDIERGVASIRQRAPEVGEQYRRRLVARMRTMLEEIGAAVREEDVIREVAAFSERTDVAEEVARLEGHLEQLRRLLDPATADPVGRTLDFLAQEMLREANTVASKSADVEISRRIVEVKSAIDRIKEQSQNAE